MELVMAEKSDYSTIGKILRLQLLVVILVTTGFMVAGTEIMALSSFLGGATAFLPNLYFAYRISRVKGDDAKKIVNSFYSGESRKILMTTLLFAFAFQVPGILFVPLMACFLAVLSVFWLALLIFARDYQFKV